MAEEDHQNGLMVYMLLWARLFFVSAAAWWIYTTLVGALTGLALSMLGVTGEMTSEFRNLVVLDLGYWQIVWPQMLKFLGFALLWWRAIKVLVLHGSPFTFGVTMTMGRENAGVSGRLVTFGHIGDTHVHRNGYTGKFWFGFIARSHPTSDKLVRSRVELLTMAFWGGWTFLVQEGKFFWFRQTHEDRAGKYRFVSDSYSKRNENMPPDRYRQKMVKAVESIKKVASGEVGRKRIDGLNWRFASGGYMYISDDFGNEMTAFKSGDAYTAKIMDDSQAVESIEKLRELACETLNPVQGA